jgi:hypothetical protein
MKFDYDCQSLPLISKDSVNIALPKDEADKLLLTGACHVDHEGFDLNEIEQAYYKHNKVNLSYDETWYKDGGQKSGTNAVIYPWFTQKTHSELVLDHSHFVFKYPIVGEARKQIEQYSIQRPELLRILSARFKAGLDLCIDYFNTDRVEPILHIEWDFDCLTEMYDTMLYVEEVIQSRAWIDSVPTILRFNDLARQKKLDAFQQADTRSMIIFGEKSYKLIPTL